MSSIETSLGLPLVAGDLPSLIRAAQEEVPWPVALNCALCGMKTAHTGRTYICREGRPSQTLFIQLKRFGLGVAGAATKNDAEVSFPKEMTVAMGSNN